MTEATKEQANFRLDAIAKKKAYRVFEQIGLKPTDAVNMFIRHVAMFGELPFTPRVPNEETVRALKEKQGKKQSLQAFKKSLGLDD